MFITIILALGLALLAFSKVLTPLGLFVGMCIVALSYFLPIKESFDFEVTPMYLGDSTHTYAPCANCQTPGFYGKNIYFRYADDAARAKCSRCNSLAPANKNITQPMPHPDAPARQYTDNVDPNSTYIKLGQPANQQLALR